MQKKSKVMGLIIAAALVISGATAVTASAVGNDAVGTSAVGNAVGGQKQFCSQKGPGWQRGDASGMFKGFLDKLVTAGTITAEQETAIQTALTNAAQSGTGRLDFKTVLANLVTAGTITADQQTAIENAMKGDRPAMGSTGRSNMFKGFLDKLVTAGTITAEQETAIRTALTNAAQSGTGRLDFKTILANLVTAGTITADQQTAIENAMTPQKSDGAGSGFAQGHMKRNGNGCRNNGKSE